MGQAKDKELLACISLVKQWGYQPAGPLSRRVRLPLDPLLYMSSTLLPEPPIIQYHSCLGSRFMRTSVSIGGNLTLRDRRFRAARE